MLVKTYNKRCRVVLTGVFTHNKKEIHLLNSNKPYGLTHELGSVPLCSLRDTPSSLKLSYATPYGLTHELGSVPLCSLRDIPSSLKLSYATVKLQFTKLHNFRNLLGRGKIPPGHQSGAMSSPWAVTAPRASQTNSTQWIGYLSLVKGPTRPQTWH